MLVNPTSLNKPEKAVLSYLLTNKPDYGYSIYKQIHEYSDKSIYVALKSLKRKGLLEIKGSDILAKAKRSRGRPVGKMYSLTLAGLCLALTGLDNPEYEPWRDLDRIFNNWGYLLPVFSKSLEQFKRVYYEDGFRHLLKKSIEDNLSGPLDELSENAILFDFIHRMLGLHGRILSPSFEFLMADWEIFRKIETYNEIMSLDLKYEAALYEERRFMAEALRNLDPIPIEPWKRTEPDELKLKKRKRRVARVLQKIVKLKEERDKLMRNWPIQEWQLLLFKYKGMSEVDLKKPEVMLTRFVEAYLKRKKKED
ncbi:helix-turn-helix transcriptional regulator [Candidatus Bathyarchaeota archaeon]|nr:helix-turn-helix transcriptional regulator [Candidatus Bathyarchaeota archaeon]